MKLDINWKSKLLNIRKQLNNGWQLIFFSLRVFNSEKQGKNAALLKNAEISQNEERLRQELRNEINELHETIRNVQASLDVKTFEAERLMEQKHEIEQKLNNCHLKTENVESLRNEISDKNRVN